MREGEKEEKKRVVEQIFFAPKLHEAHKFTAEDLLDLKPLRILEIDSLLDDILPGLTIKDRSYHGVSYPRCFVGENLVAYLVLPGVSMIIFRTFSCESFDNGKTLLRADYTVDCESPRHKWF